MLSKTSSDIQQSIGEQVINSLDVAVGSLFTSVETLEQKINPFLTTDNSKVANCLTEDEWPAYFAQLRESIYRLQALNEKVKSLIERFPI